MKMYLYIINVQMPRPIRVIDSRHKQYFVVDDVYLNGYANILGTAASMIYISLCRHADKEQSSFPSQKFLAKELHISERTVVTKLAELVRWNLIETNRVRDENGKWLRNTYTLLDKSIWIKPPSATIAHGPSANNDISVHVQPLHTKDTHSISMKDTHIRKEINKEKNVITEDPDFTLWEQGDSRAIDRLNDRYPAWKYSREWSEAKKAKFEKERL